MDYVLDALSKYCRGDNSLGVFCHLADKSKTFRFNFNFMFVVKSLCICIHKKKKKKKNEMLFPPANSSQGGRRSVKIGGSGDQSL